MQGESTALDAGQQHGLQVFVDSGCAACHNGRLLGGSSYQRFGIVDDYTRHTGSPEDIGRMALTGNEADRRVFKVPSLRHAVQTAPYFHDGSVASLDKAIAIMAQVQLGKQLADEEIGAIRRFLAATTAPMPEALRPAGDVAAQ